MEFSKVKELVREKNAEYESRRRQLHDAYLKQLSDALCLVGFPEGSEITDISAERIHVQTEDSEGKEVLVEALSVPLDEEETTPPFFEAEKVYISAMYGDFDNCIDLWNFTNGVAYSWSEDDKSLIVKIEDAPRVMRKLVDWVHEHKN